jgi:GMP synthase (glutamine-hydrolysing)
MAPPNKIVIVVTGDPVPAVFERRGDYGEMMKAAIGDSWTGGYAVVDARTESLGSDLDDAAVVITGSAANVHTREAWMMRTETRLRELHERHTPILGICFGHQLVAQALGGQVGPNPRGREVSTVVVETLRRDPLLEGIAETFTANACHSDTVSELPRETAILARSTADPHQVLRFGDASWGVQFHPEFDGEVMRHFLDARSEAIVAEGFDLAELQRQASDTPDARIVFRNFIRYVAGR